ncbi:oligosaccharide flippase family protein [Robertmurraya massiliosenegalensis]|uniref:lipopolysaccharide biosynthesis protein n=1 Tax=Robertmurraya massiliosenegalensis TaxID=1287657 RepID=UPI003D274D37
MIGGEDLIAFKSQLNRLITNSGFKNIAILSSGVLLAQLFNIISQPIITRLYTPEDFGILSLITSMVTIFTPLVTLQYQMGIISAKTDKEANVVCALTFYVLSITVLIISICLIIFNIIYPTTFEETGIWIIMVAPLLLFSGLVKIVESYNNRFEQYKLMSKIALQRSITSNILKIILGLFRFNFIGLIVSQFVATIFGIRRQAQTINANRNDVFSATFSEMKSIALKYKVQPLYSMPGLFVTMGSFSILPILINSLYSVEETGYFALSMSILAIPLSLISNNVGKVFFRKATLEKEQKGNFYSTFVSTSLLLLIISAIGFTILWFIAEPIFSLIFGQEWSRSGLFVKVMVPLFAIRFVVTGLMNGFIISGKQLLKLLIQLLFIIVAIVIYAFTKVKNLPIETFLELINNGYFVLYAILFFVLFITSKNRTKTK